MTTSTRCSAPGSCSCAGAGEEVNRMRLLIVTAIALGAACAEKPSASQQASQPVVVPAVTIDSGRILDRIKVLSSDEYEGRAPGTKGEELTVTLPRGRVQEARAEAGQHRRHLRPESAARRHHRGEQPAADRQRRARRSRRSSGPTTWWRGRSTSPTARRSRTRSWCSPATASRRRSSTGTTSRTST